MSALAGAQGEGLVEAGTDRGFSPAVAAAGCGGRAVACDTCHGGSLLFVQSRRQAAPMTIGIAGNAATARLTGAGGRQLAVGIGEKCVMRLENGPGGSSSGRRGGKRIYYVARFAWVMGAACREAGRILEL